MRLSFQYRLYPLSDQALLLKSHRTELAYLWNFALAERRDAWAREQRSIHYLEQQRELTRWRAYDRDGVARLSVAVAQDCLQRLDLAFRAFFRRVKSGKRPGYPRFRREVDSFTFTPSVNPVVLVRNGTWRLKVPRVGEIPIRLHRPLPADASVKTVSVSHEAGRWFATISLEITDPPPPPRVPPRAPVGVDLGLTHLATFSTGEVFGAPGFFRRGERRLRIEQRRLARKDQGSQRYGRQRERVARAYAKIRRQRRGYAHQLSHDLAERFDLVVFEDLQISRMIERNRLAKEIADAGWGMLRDMTAYKEAIRSGRCIRVPSRWTTQDCSQCGRRADPPLRLEHRTYRCPCGYEGGRDDNAARNILARGMTLLTEELRRNAAEEKRVERGPPPRQGGRKVYQRRRADAGKREPGIVLGAPFERPTAMVGLGVAVP